MKNRLRTAVLILVGLLLFLCFPSCTVDGSEIVEPKRLTWAIGTPLPNAEDYFDELAEGASVSFADENHYAELQAGENLVELIYRPKKGKKQRLTAVLELVHDSQPPTITGAKDIIAYLGDGVAYRAGIVLDDNCDGEIRLLVDSVAVNTAVEGTYPVIYWATDAAGNTTTVQITVHVYREEITLEMLNAQIDPIIQQLGLQTMNKQQQARAIYAFVHTDAKIEYVDTSDKSSWIREAYFCFQNRKGDCFTYFALSKAFFERLGIPNMDIQRLPGYTDDTHYWSLINISEASDGALWYHFDACRLRGIANSGCLLTDAQVDAFSRMRPNFYLYDRNAYPTTATEILTPRPDLEPYY